MKDQRKKIIKKARRVVVKVGSAVVLPVRGVQDKPVFDRLAPDIHDWKKKGKEFVIVSSGAIALGMERLSMKERPATIPERQAVAAVGQSALMSSYEAAFSKYNEVVAQVLLTHDDFSDRKRFLNARNTLTTLLGYGMVPVINENDTVAVDEIKFGDNDRLSALTTNLVEADLLVILTNVDGLYDKNPEKDSSAKKIAFVEDVDGIKPDWLTKGTSALGTGGIMSKCEAAKTAAHFGVPTVIAMGFSDEVLDGILEGADVGTFFLPKEDRLTSKKHWIAFSTRPSGRVFVDEGAKEALLKKGKSLLPSGIKDVDGAFDAGEVVHCVDLKGMEFARGVVNYSSMEIVKIKGIKTTEIVKTLGYKVYDEVIHRDNLVVM
ncbi:MAG: glutamate 5-kinase [Deltaproteobacteria bacterium]|nr:glutamate 5-kinase [Deltaproteobacteria bacterium]